MTKSNNFMVQAESADRAHRQMSGILLKRPSFKENDVLLVRFPEREVKDCVVVAACRVMRVETGHVLLEVDDGKRVWMSKEDVTYQNHAAYACALGG